MAGSVILWTWDYVNNEYVRVPACVIPKRLVLAGPVAGGAHKLYWIALNPSAGNSAIELTDDTDGSTAIVFDHFDTSREGHMLSLSPPMPFSTGIYLKTFTSMTSVIFGYV